MKFYLLDGQEENINAVTIALPRSERRSQWHSHWCPTCRRYWEHPGREVNCEHGEQYHCPRCARGGGK
jgi:hypothetical protein